MTQRTSFAGLHIDILLYQFIRDEVLPGLDISEEQVWQGFAGLLETHADRNQELLVKRAGLQAAIDDWYLHGDPNLTDTKRHEKYLRNIGYLAAEPGDFTIATENVDTEIAQIAAPQLVVPASNARFAINAANARWGSLYDALYGTDAIPLQPDTKPGYDPTRGAQVINWAKQFLDTHFALSSGNYNQVNVLRVRNGKLVGLIDGDEVPLKSTDQFKGFTGTAEAPTSILLTNNGLHVDILIDAGGAIGAADPAGINDVILESAVTTIIDCEDSVAAVDGEDKTNIYRNWLGLMKGDLEASFIKGGKLVSRSMDEDRKYIRPNGETFTLPGRSLMLVRNVGHLMTTPAVTWRDGQEVPEGLLDSLMTSLIAMHDLQREGGNSKTGSVYIVKPKMHGPEEVAFANSVFNGVEEILDLPRNTLKIGVMDEERRTTLNLRACINEVRGRIIFINTGFLDRTGDELHTAKEAGPAIRKGDIKSASWLSAYEDNNVDAGLSTAFHGRAQIGKGMWAMPDEMAAMLEQKIGHPKAGANCAWAPSPTAATLHATHYHAVNVASVQKKLMKRTPAKLSDLLEPPIAPGSEFSTEEVQNELDNNVQGLLGYVVRWINHGVGCSKVPDINNVGLMEDRATLRISSQHIANWLHHGVCSKSQVEETLRRMAAIVDEQNSGDRDYIAMAPNFKGSIAFQAASELVFAGLEQPNGYTEPVLHRQRLEFKQAMTTN